MNTTLDKISHKAQRAAASVIIDKVLAMVDKDREKGFLELVDWAEQFWAMDFPKKITIRLEQLSKILITDGLNSSIVYWMKQILMLPKWLH